MKILSKKKFNNLIEENERLIRENRILEQKESDSKYGSVVYINTNTICFNPSGILCNCAFFKRYG